MCADQISVKASEERIIRNQYETERKQRERISLESIVSETVTIGLIPRSSG